MLVKPVITIGYKCETCGRLNVEYIDIFKTGKTDIKCKCGESAISVAKIHNEFIFESYCFDCDKNHVYKYGYADIKNSKKIVCPATGSDKFYVGSKKEVIKMMESMENNLNELAKKVGLKSHFTNQDVMMQVLDKIHEYAQRDGIICSCHKPILSLKLMKNGIMLTCDRCYDSIVISAGNIEDLLDLTNKAYIKLNSNKNRDSKY